MDVGVAPGEPDEEDRGAREVGAQATLVEAEPQLQDDHGEGADVRRGLEGGDLGRVAGAVAPDLRQGEHAGGCPSIGPLLGAAGAERREDDDQQPRAVEHGRRAPHLAQLVEVRARGQRVEVADDEEEDDRAEGAEGAPGLAPLVAGGMQGREGERQHDEAEG